MAPSPRPVVGHLDRLAAECEGPAIRCYCDGRLVLEVTDDTFSGGRVGMIVPSGRRLRFTNLFAEPR